MSKDRHHHDWLSLIEISGPFLAVPVLDEAFPQGLDELDGIKRKRLRQAYEEWRDALETDDPQLPELHAAWIDEVLSRGLELDEDGLGDVLKRNEWCATHLSVTFPEHGATSQPDLAVVDEQQSNKPLLLVHTYPHDVDLDAAQKQGGWTATPAERMVQLCRSLGCRLGLVTNGERWMLVDAPVGAVTTFASWYARIWSQEPITLQAFVHLLGIRRFFVDEAEQLPALFDRSLKYQDEVTDALGEQVRRAVEVLIQALDKADQDRDRELLRNVKETELYEAALTVMMRLVFLLSAEERGLLLLGDERYEANYALSTLRMQLRTESPEILERRWDAWSRLLAIFRAVFGGIEHENLRLPALGGSLFDPDRFPFLEGRAQGSSWRSDAAKPLPIDNRTVLLLLDAIQQFQGRTLSYRALDVEQIGYVYEGLLERTVKRTSEVTLELNSTKSAKAPWVTLAELDSARLDGAERLVELLKERSGSSASRVSNDLAKPVDDALADRLLAASHGDTALRDRIKPYAHLLRSDPWGYPLVYPARAFIVTTGSDRRESGTHYTPKSLTEAIVDETLTPIAYVGPAEGAPREQWVLKSPAELLELKICDPAMGSGAFLVQACRWLGDRLVEAWSQAEGAGKTVSVDGEVLDAANTTEPLPRDAEARTVIARRLIAECCLYGVDVNPLAVELAKLSIWLITLAKGRPFGFLDHNLRCGDSLLGIVDLDQLHYLEMDPGRGSGRKLFAQRIDQALKDAIDLRRQLRARPIRDIHDVEAMATLNERAWQCVELPETIADALVGEVLAVGGKTVDVATLSIEAGEALEADGDNVQKLRRRAHACLSNDLPAGKPMRRPFHWVLEFPEVFNREGGGFDAIIGNPPFLGGKRISTVMGGGYNAYLVDMHPGASKNMDLIAHFFRRAFVLLSRGGCFGLIATNTVAEGDTRQGGLERLLGQGASIYSAHPNEPWPGAAAVVTSRVHIRKGEWNAQRNLSGRPAGFISAYLSDREEWTPKPLKVNKNIAFQGSIVLGMGFVLSHEQAQRMLDDDPRNAEVILPYLNGQDLNSHPEQNPGRWVINFWDWPEEKAASYLRPYEWVKDHVYPERLEKSKEKSYRNIMSMWWQHWNVRPGLYHAIGRGARFRQHPRSSGGGRELSQVLAVARVSKTLGFTFVDPGSVFADQIVVFAVEATSHFAVLQSNIHAVFSWKNSSKLKNDLRYSPTDAFETFPLPLTDDSLSDIGERLHQERSAVMRGYRIGLTKLYNRFHTDTEADSRIDGLRALQREMDAAVARVYGWDDLDLEHGFHEVPYLPEGDRIRFTISEPARTEVLRRLSELNRQRYEEEVAQGLHGSRTTGTAKRKPRLQGTESRSVRQSSFGFDAAAVNKGHVLKAAEPRPDYQAGTADIIVAHLEAHPGWHTRTEILAATGVTDGLWKSAIAALIDAGRVERYGERRGARYRFVWGREK